MGKAEGSGIAVFSHEMFGEIRIVDQDGEHWFVAKDVCDALSIRNASDAVGRLDDDEKGTIGVTDGGPDRNIINESGLYSVVLRSQKPEAKAFKRWVTHDVLPQIRKTGSYQKPTSEKEMVLGYLAALEREGQLLEKIEEDAPKIDFYERVTGSEAVCQLGAACQLGNLPFGRNILFQKLRDQGVLISVGDRRNHPRQEYVNRGLFTVVENAFTDDETGRTHLTYTTHATQRGIDWLIKRFCNNSVA